MKRSMFEDIKDRLRAPKRPEHIRFTAYVSKPVFDEFRRQCEDVSVSKVLEQLMHLFVEQEKAQKERK